MDIKKIREQMTINTSTIPVIETSQEEIEYYMSLEEPEYESYFRSSKRCRNEERCH